MASGGNVRDGDTHNFSLNDCEDWCMGGAHPLYINGEFIVGGPRETLPVLSPATGEPCARLTCADAGDVAAAARAAGREQRSWSSSTPAKRAELLRAMAGKVCERRERIAREMTLEQGKPISEALEELQGVAAVLRYFADVAESYSFRNVVPGDADRHIFETGKGGVLIINTWNFPVETVVSHMAPSLAAGCASVVLANRDAPGCVAGFLLCHGGAGSSRWPDQSRDGEVITNLEATGRMSRDCARVVYRIRCCGQETGATGRCGPEACDPGTGRACPAIVLPGSNAETAAVAYAGKRFWNAGQVCTSPNRIYVNHEQYEDFIAAVKDFAESLTVGDGMSDDTDVGPMANERRVDWMQKVVADALARGARFITGQRESQPGGFYWKPTVLADVSEDALGFREEVFGPVALIRAYDSLDRVIASVNDCDIGLSGYVFGPDDAEALAVARRLEVGSAGVNQMVTAFIDTPFGGIKKSGLGTVGGVAALREYLFPRSFAVPSGVIGVASG